MTKQKEKAESKKGCVRSNDTFTGCNVFINKINRYGKQLLSFSKDRIIFENGRHPQTTHLGGVVVATYCTKDRKEDLDISKCFSSLGTSYIK